MKRALTILLRYKRASKAMQLYEEINPLSKEPYVDKREGIIRQLYVAKKNIMGHPPKHVTVVVSWEEGEEVEK